MADDYNVGMNTATSPGVPGIMDAVQILFHLLYFVFVLSATSLFLEKVWIGRTRWIILPVIALSLVLFSIHPGLVPGILTAIIGPSTISNLAVITGSGILAGMVATSL